MPSKSLKIAFVASGDPEIDTFGSVASGGSGPIERLATTIQNRGHEVTIYAGMSGPSATDSIRGVDIQYVSTSSIGAKLDSILDWLPLSERIVKQEQMSTTPGRVVERLVGRLAFSWRVRRRLELNQPDVVYLRDRISALFPSWAEFPSVFTVVAPDACRFNYEESVSRHPLNVVLFWYKYAIERSVVSNVDQTIAMNERIKREYQKLAGDAISVVALGVRQDSFVDMADRNERPMVLYVGRFDANKRPEFLLRGFARAAPEPYELHMIGDGPRFDHVRRRVSELDIGDRVRLYGKVPRSEVLERMRESALFVLPSKFENCPNVIVEAMASGCPVLASDTVGAETLITDEKTGVLFDAESEESYQRALESLLENDRQRHSLAKSAYEYARENLTVEKITEEYLEIGQRAMRRGSNRT